MMKIDFSLVPLKAVNFFLQAALACFLPYKSILQKQLGISEAQNGIIMAVEKIFSLLAPSCFGILTDRFSLHKSAMVVFAILSAFFSFPIYFIPSIDLKNVTGTALNVSSTASSCYYDNSSFHICKKQCQMCDWHCQRSDLYGLTFAMILLFSILFVIVSVPLSSLVDATTMYILGKERLHLYGMQRLWGAVGFGLVGLLIGFLVDVYSDSSSCIHKDYLLAFICLTVLHLLAAAVISQLKVPKHRLTSLFSGLGDFVKNPQILLLLFIVFLSGFNLGTRYAFTFWYIDQLPGSSNTILGLSVFTGCFSEIPMFFVSGWLIKRFDYFLSLSLGLLAAGIQCFLYTVITVAWPILLIETLHGLSFALPMAAMCTYAAELAPEGMAATLIGLTQGIYWGLGNMAGALTSGVIYEVYGGTVMFLVNFVVSVVGSLTYYFAATFMKTCSAANQTSSSSNTKSQQSKDQQQENVKSPMLENL